jgi:hypothetical protein
VPPAVLQAPYVRRAPPASSENGMSKVEVVTVPPDRRSSTRKSESKLMATPADSESSTVNGNPGEPLLQVPGETIGPPWMVITRLALESVGAGIGLTAKAVASDVTDSPGQLP